jgi:hypothetical protein
LHLFGDDAGGGGDGDVGGGGLHLLDRLGLGLGDLFLRHAAAPLDGLGELLAGLGGEDLGFLAGLGDDRLGLLVGVAALALIVGEQPLGFFAQLARLVEFLGNALGALVEHDGPPCPAP